MTQSLPLTYPDAVCLDDLDAFGNETSSDLQTLFQDVYHILIESPGSNIDDPNRGLGVEDLLSGPMPDLGQLGHEYAAQFQKDDRIDAAKVTVTATTNDQAGAEFDIAIQLTVDGAVYGLSYGLNAANGLFLKAGP